MKTETVEEFLARGGKIERQPEPEHRRDFSRHAVGNAIYERRARRLAALREARELAKPESTP
jgi:hypothetical protein